MMPLQQEKLKLNLRDLLPDIPEVDDNCVDRLSNALNSVDGITKVHIDNYETKTKCCIHYKPDEISRKDVYSIVREKGRLITEKYKHLNLEVSGIRHQRHAHLIQSELNDENSIIDAAVSATGIIQIEYDTYETNENSIIETISEHGLNIVNSSGSDKHNSTQSEHDHNSGVFGENTELYFAIGSGVFWVTGLILSFIQAVPEAVSITSYIVALMFGGYFTSIEAYQSLRKGHFDIDFLMIFAAIGASILGNWQEAALLLFLFSLGHALEHYAMNKARKSISDLADLTPPTALLKQNDDLVEVPIEKLKRNDVIVVKPNTTIAADGAVIKGKSSVNQSPITGESLPVDKFPVDEINKGQNLDNLEEKNKVFAGTINGNSVLEIVVLKKAKDSTLSRLITLVREAETQKSPTQNLTDKFEKYFVPAVLIFVIILLFAFLIIDETFSDSFYRAMAVLVASSPCALAISTPSAVLAGISRAANSGVLIKGGKPLEDLGQLSILAFDKTGTLTEGKPKLTDVISINNFPQEELLKIVIAVEQLSDHPLAKAITTGANKMIPNAQIQKATNLTSLTARGVSAGYGDDSIYIGNRRLYKEVTGRQLENEYDSILAKLENEGHTSMLVIKENLLIGIIAVMDTPREQAKATLSKLRTIGIEKMIMLTGDNQRVADSIAKEVGITEANGNLLPEDKLSRIKSITEKEGRVAMIGDGVNDAPAMAESTVGIAMGAAGSDLALETADIALMADKLEILPYAIGLSRKARQIIAQNLWISLGMICLLVPLTIFSVANIGWAVVAHEGSTLLVVLNALRLLGYKE